tara:strand:+ start:831 stop:1109 length:279 start_codon:yes stop_codon:yes gene_type:complete
MLADRPDRTPGGVTQQRNPSGGAGAVGNVAQPAWGIPRRGRTGRTGERWEVISVPPVAAIVIEVSTAETPFPEKELVALLSPVLGYQGVEWH